MSGELLIQLSCELPDLVRQAAAISGLKGYLNCNSLLGLRGGMRSSPPIQLGERFAVYLCLNILAFNCRPRNLLHRLRIAASDDQVPPGSGESDR